MTVALVANIARPISSAISTAFAMDNYGKLNDYGKLGAWSPLSLFAASEVGAWYDPSDLTTMFKDRAGTTLVTADGQPVGLILDKSLGALRSSQFAQINGGSGAHLSSPNTGLPTGDLDIRLRAAHDAAPTNPFFISKWLLTGTGPNSFVFGPGASNSSILQLFWSIDGATAKSANCTVAHGVPLGTVKWWRVTLDTDNGAGGQSVDFYISDDGVAWTKLGATVTVAGLGSVNVNSTPLTLSGFNSATNNPFYGRVYKAQILDGIGGNVVIEFDPTLYTGGTTCPATLGNTWTIIQGFGLARIVPSGNHAVAPSDAARPLKTSTGAADWTNYDAVDDVLNTTFPSSLGSDCTVCRANVGGAPTILTGQTIGTSYADSTDNAGLIIINRALTEQETTDVTAWLTAKGATA